MLYMTKEKFEEICEKYPSLLVVKGDVSEALNFVQDLLEAEADALKEREPHAVKTIERLNQAAYEVFDVLNDIEGEEFLEEEVVPAGPKVVRTMDELEDYLEDYGWTVNRDDGEWEIGQYSPAGEDFWFAIHHDGDVEKAIKEIKRYASDFDIDEHVELNLDVRGAPGVVALAEDAKEIQKMLNDLADNVNWCEQKTIGESCEKGSLDEMISDAEGQKRDGEIGQVLPDMGER